MKTTASLLLTFLLLTQGFTQNFDYSIHLNTKSIDGLDGTHSYAFGTSEGKWLIVGGRKDGIHARQPMNAFPSSSNNDEMMVIDVEGNAVYSSGLASLSTNLQEQLQSTNMCFHQIEDTLYIVGGYAYSTSSQDHKTFPFLTTVIVSETINAIENGEDVSDFIKQLENQNMAVTGGHLAYLDEQFIIVGGHRFDGRYNPMGHNTYVQTYTDAIRKFTINNSGTSPVIDNYSETVDVAHLHRRDYNLVPQSYDGEFGYMISSGVFQHNVDLPFLYPVEIKTTGHTPITTFNQYLSNYHSATVTLFDQDTKSNHSFFFGGISRYYYDGSTLITDDNVPFVKTISQVTRDSNNQLNEYQLPIEMPELIGASAEFFRNENLPSINDEIISIQSNMADSVLLGHIYGGIKSTSLNPFSSNNTSQTSAYSNLIEVWLINETPNGIAKLNGNHAFEVSVFPNPAKDKVSVKMSAPIAGNGYILLTDASGKIVKNLTVRDLKKGFNEFEILDVKDLASGNYFFTFNLNDIYFDTASLVVKH